MRKPSFRSRLMLLFVSVPWLIAPFPRAQANGFGVGSGAGSVELEFVYVTANLREYLRPCRGTSACSLTAPEAAALERVWNDGTAMLAQSLQFKSGAKVPGLFPTDAANLPALYVVDDISRQVTINLDRLYPLSPDGELEPLPWLDILASVGEFAARLEGLDMADARDLGRKISTPWSAGTEELDLSDYGQSAGLLFTDPANPSAAGSLLFEGDHAIQDLTAQVLAQLPCPDAGSRATRLVSLAHWAWLAVEADPSAGSDRVSARARGDVRYACAHAGSGTDSALLRGTLDLGLSLVIRGATVAQFLGAAPAAQVDLAATPVIAQGSLLSVLP